MRISKHLSKIVILLFILSLIVLMYLGIFSSGNVKKVSPLIDKPAPTFDLRTFSGNTVTLDELEGNAVVINFWASWCIPCISEIQILEKAHTKFEDQPIKIIGVNIWDEKQAAMDFLEKYNVSFTNAYDPDEKIQIDYGVGGVPETFFVNKNGLLAEKYSGELTQNILNYFLSDILSHEISRK